MTVHIFGIKTADPEQFAEAIVRGLFEQDGHRMPNASRYAAKQALKAAATEWKAKLLADAAAETEKWKLLSRDDKMRADELELRFAQLKAEGKL